MMLNILISDDALSIRIDRHEILPSLGYGMAEEGLRAFDMAWELKWKQAIGE